MARERVDRHTIRLLREVGMPEMSDEQIQALAARIRESYAAELAAQLQEFQIASTPTGFNVGGHEGLDAIEDGAPIMLDNCQSEGD